MNGGAAAGARRRALSCVLGCCLLSTCKGGPIPVGESKGPGGTGGGAALEPVAQRCADEVAQRVLDAECWPTRHVGRWHGFVTGDARYWSVGPILLEYPSDDVLLEIDAEGSASIRFAPGDAGAASASAACTSDGGVAPCAPAPALLPGFAYGLVGLRMTGGPREDRRLDPRLDFSLRIAEPWSAFCAAPSADAWPCACGAEGCGVSPQSLQGNLELAQDGQALRGTVRSTGASEELTAGWEFVRE